MVTNICIVCGTSFSTNYLNKRCCSTQCYAKYRAMVVYQKRQEMTIEKACIVCGMHFSTTNSIRKYCNTACATKQHKLAESIRQSMNYKHVERHVICNICKNRITVTGKKVGIPYCCDSCAKDLIAHGMSSRQLYKRGVSYCRSVRLGYKSKRIECPICHQFFTPTSYLQKLCRKPGCPSSDRIKYKAHHKYHPMRVHNVHRDTGETACKNVVCTPMNKYRDQILVAYPGFITAEQFNETRKIIMTTHCKSYTNPRTAAAAIFYLTFLRLKIRLPLGGQEGIAHAVESCSATLRRYVRKYHHLLFG